MKKTKLNGEHIFLQFLMMFLTLCLLLVFSILVQNILWFKKIEIIIPIISGAVSILVGVLSLYKHFLVKTKQRTFLLLAIFFLLLGFMTIFTSVSGTLSFSTEKSLSIILIPVLLSVFLTVFLKKEWLYSNLYFWILFSLSLFLFSRMFFLQAIIKQQINFQGYAYVVTLFGYVALFIGIGNDLWETLSKRKGAKKGKKK